MLTFLEANTCALSMIPLAFATLIDLFHTSHGSNHKVLMGFNSMTFQTYRELWQYGFRIVLSRYLIIIQALITSTFGGQSLLSNVTLY